jgi:undecaprenyl diphosphate synthase
MATGFGLRRKKTATPPPLPLDRIPQHVAVIMDGNGRWARSRGLPRMAGHRAGSENIRRIIQRFADYDIRYLTLYAFSTENWERPNDEVKGLMRLLSRFLKRETQHLHENGIRLVHLGDLSPLKPKLQQEVHDAIELTRNNDRMTLAIAFNYGGRAEIVEAVRKIVASGIAADDVTEELVAGYMTTAALPDPDLVIRTAGEMRISNFLLWQSAYAEFYSLKTYWPDFDVPHIDECLKAYARRVRRFGAIPQSEAGPALNGANGHHGSHPGGTKPSASKNGHTTSVNGHHT